MTRYGQNMEIAGRQIDGQAVLVEPSLGVVFVLNSVGARIWQLIESPQPVANVCQHITEEFEVGEARVEIDVETFLEHLAERGLAIKQ